MEQENDRWKLCFYRLTLSEVLYCPTAAKKIMTHGLWILQLIVPFSVWKENERD